MAAKSGFLLDAAITLIAQKSACGRVAAGAFLRSSCWAQ